MEYRDKFGQPLIIDDTVIVDDPINDDAWEHSFMGQIIGFRNGWAQVVDGEGLVWEMEPEKCEFQYTDEL